MQTLGTLGLTFDFSTVGDDGVDERSKKSYRRWPWKPSELLDVDYYVDRTPENEEQIGCELVWMGCFAQEARKILNALERCPEAAFTEWSKPAVEAKPADDLLSIEELASLARLTENRIHSALSEARKPAATFRPPEPVVKGKRHYYSYREIRPWLLSTWPGNVAFFPESFAEVKNYLQHNAAPA